MKTFHECAQCGWLSYEGETHNCTPAPFRFEDIVIGDGDVPIVVNNGEGEGRNQ